MSGRMMKPWIVRPIITVTKYKPSFANSSPRSLVARIWPAIKKQTPTGVR